WDSSHVNGLLLCGCLPTELAPSLPANRGGPALCREAPRSIVMMEGGAGGGLLDSISEFCRRAGMAESTFGRHAVNDGKFVARLRDGARITPETPARLTPSLPPRGIAAPESPPELKPLLRVQALGDGSLRRPAAE